MDLFESPFHYLCVALFISSLLSIPRRPRAGGPSHIFLSQNEYINCIEAWRAASSSGPSENKAWAVGIAGTASTAVGQCQAAIQRSNVPKPFPPAPVTQNPHSSSRSKRGQAADPYKLLLWVESPGWTQWAAKSPVHHLHLEWKFISVSNHPVMEERWRQTLMSRPRPRHHLLKLHLLTNDLSMISLIFRTSDLDFSILFFTGREKVSLNACFEMSAISPYPYPS